MVVGWGFDSCEPKRAVGFSNEDPVDRKRVEVDVEIERATKALDDGHRPRSSLRVPRRLGPFPVEAEQRARIDRKDGAAKFVIPREAIAKLEREAQHPLANGHVREDMIDEMRGTLGHPAPPAARAETTTFAGERNQTVRATACTPKAREPMRKHSAANEALKLTLDEQGDTAFVVTLLELPKEGLEVLADDAVQHSVLRRPTNIGSRDLGTRGGGVKLHRL